MKLCNITVINNVGIIFYLDIPYNNTFTMWERKKIIFFYIVLLVKFIKYFILFIGNG